jgi:hypothetical protein
MIKSTQKQFYVGDHVTNKEMKSLGIDTQGMKIEEKMRIARQNIFGVPTGEFRPPRAGEWYISGAIPLAYRAAGNFSIKFHIAKLVILRKIVTETYVPY